MIIFSPDISPTPVSLCNRWCRYFSFPAPPDSFAVFMHSGSWFPSLSTVSTCISLPGTARKDPECFGIYVPRDTSLPDDCLLWEHSHPISWPPSVCDLLCVPHFPAALSKNTHSWSVLFFSFLLLLCSLRGHFHPQTYVRVCFWWPWIQDTLKHSNLSVHPQGCEKWGRSSSSWTSKAPNGRREASAFF